MRRLASPEPVPTSQHAGTASGNDAAMTAGAPPAPIPVSSPRPQPTEAVPGGAATWVATPSAGTA